MIKILINEITANKKMYVLLIISYIIICEIIYPLLKISHYELGNWNLALGILVTNISMFKRFQMMSIHSKFPISNFDLYLIRLMKYFLSVIIFFIIISILNIFDNIIIFFESFFEFLFFIYLSFVFQINIDLKVYTKEMIFKKKLIFFIFYNFIFLIMLVMMGYIVKNRELLGDYLLLKISVFIFFITIGFSISYYIFKLRKNYKI